MFEITYRGVDHYGNAHAGRVEVLTIPGFVEGHYLAGWQDMTVHLEVEGGGHKVVGRIQVRPDGRRVWWAEQTG